MTIKFKKYHENARIPEQAYDGDYGYDCYAVSCEEIAPNVYKYGLGFGLQAIVPPELETKKICITIRPRSSVHKTGMVLSNSIATIDKGYTGELSATFYHVLHNLPKYEVGDKVCQLHIDITEGMYFVEVDELDETERGSNSYGSSGKK